jgi:hypothetical protein
MPNRQPAAGRRQLAAFLTAFRKAHVSLRNRILGQVRGGQGSDLSPSHETAGDTIYPIDRLSEEILREVLLLPAKVAPFVLVAEGFEEDPAGVLFRDANDSREPAYRVLMDPVDGTRVFSYDKRSAWILTGIAPASEEPRLSSVVAALQTEIPTSKQERVEQFWALKGGGAGGELVDLGTGGTRRLSPRGSSAGSLDHGFAQISRFFPGRKDELAGIEEEVFAALPTDSPEGKVRIFEDQYISTGGQFRELFTGRDRFCADLRPLVNPKGLACHPYDVASLLIALESGVIVTDPAGRDLDAPFDTTTPVAWAAYANQRLRALIEPPLQKALRKRGLL